MKTYTRNLFILLLLVMMAITSCEIAEDEPGSDDPRDKMTGTWQFSENSVKSTRSISYTVNITKDPDNSSQVILENLGNPGSFDIHSSGIVTSSQIVVSEQTLSNGWVIEGSGKLVSSGTMNWTYSLIAGGDIEEYTAVATKL